MSEDPAGSLVPAGGTGSNRGGSAWARGRLAVDVAAWALLVVVGFAFLLVYESTPGEAASPPARWPTETSLTPARAGAWSLVVFAHPRCPCTRATLDSLARLTARGGDRLEASVVLVRDQSTEEGWERGDLREKAERIPGVRLHVDAGGVEARRFGAVSSGQTLLFDPDGALRFSGGLTVLRGHDGDSPGSGAVEALLAGREPSVVETPVYGCPLLAAACEGGDEPCTR
jgi:hypothetical protein